MDRYARSALSSTIIINAIHSENAVLMPRSNERTHPLPPLRLRLGDANGHVDFGEREEVELGFSSRLRRDLACSRNEEI